MTSAAEEDANPESCEYATLEYRGVCFRAHPVRGNAYRHPLQLDGEPGHELVGIDDEGVTVHRFEGDGFALIGEADVLEASLSLYEAVAGEFDALPGIDLSVVAPGDWAALYHLDPLDEDGALTLVGQTAFAGPYFSHAMFRPVAIGPDASGRWRAVANLENGESPFYENPLALWEVQGSTWVQVEQFELPTKMCELSACTGGDFNGDGRVDAVCFLRRICPSDVTDDTAHVIVLAEADGTVTTAAYPSMGESGIATDLDGNGITDLVQGEGSESKLWYRLGDGTGGLDPVAWIDLPTSAPLSWETFSAGDLDGDGDVELMLGNSLQALIFDDVVGAPQTYDRLELNEGQRLVAWSDMPIDVNGDSIVDSIVDLARQNWNLLVSEVQQ